MKKFVLTMALMVTACNLAAGIVYAAVCESSGGARACGSTCSGSGTGSCECTGSCSDSEMDWVGKAKLME